MTDIVAIFLVILFTILFVTGLYQLVDVVLSNNKKLSQKNFILSFLTTGAAFRIIFWIKVCIPTEVSDRIMLVIFFLPLWFNFAGLSGLAVFYATALDFVKYYRKIPVYISIAANIILLMLNLAISITLTNDSVEEDGRILTILYTLYATCLDLSLAAILGFLGHKFQQITIIRNVLPRSINTFGAVNWVVVACYTLRGILTPSLLIVPSEYSEIQYNGHHPQTSFVILFFFLLTEFLPNFCVMLLLWKVTGITQSKYQSLTMKSLDRLLDISLNGSDNNSNHNNNNSNNNHQYNHHSHGHQEIWQGSSELFKDMDELSVALLVKEQSEGEMDNRNIQDHRVTWQEQESKSNHSQQDYQVLGHAIGTREKEKDRDSELSASENTELDDTIYSNQLLLSSGSSTQLGPMKGAVLSSNLPVFQHQQQHRNDRNYIPSDHSALADGVQTSNLSLHTPSPQLIHVGNSYESSPGSADFLWQQIYSQQNPGKISFSGSTTSALHRSPPPIPIPHSGTPSLLIDSRGSVHMDGSGFLPRRQATPSLLPSEYNESVGGNISQPPKEKYGNFMSPRDILLMTTSSKVVDNTKHMKK